MLNNALIRLGVNGRVREVTWREKLDLRCKTLLQYLREDLKLRGTKQGCGEGGCGACTVILTRPSEKASQERLAVASCLVPLAYTNGMHVHSIEGVRDESEAASELVNRLVDANAVQCGYCTPGIVMALYSMLLECERDGVSPPTSERVERALDGNLCRCTGYTSILSAAHSLCTQPIDMSGALRDVALPQPVRDGGDRVRWFEPSSVDELHALLASDNSDKSEKSSSRTGLVGGLSSTTVPAWHPRVSMMAGNSELGYKLRYHPDRLDAIESFASVRRVAVMHELRFDDDARTLFVGAAVTINELWRALEQCARADDPGFRALRTSLRFFANNQVRNMATVGGSLATADHISDLYPALNALDATIVLHDGTRVASSAFARNAPPRVSPDVVIVGLHVPYSARDGSVSIDSFAHAKRRVDAQSQALLAVYARRDEQGRVAECRVCFGGSAIDKSALHGGAGTRALHAEEALAGAAHIDEALYERVARALVHDDVPPSPSTKWHRRALLLSLWRKAYLCMAATFDGQDAVPREHRIDRYDFAHARLERSYVCSGAEAAARNDDVRPAPIGHGMTQLDALRCARGEQEFAADVLPAASMLHAAVVLSTRPSARLRERLSSSARVASLLAQFDDGDALGSVSLVDSADVCGDNRIGSIANDEPVFADDAQVNWHGQMVALVTARTRHVALQAAKVIENEGVAYGDTREWRHRVDESTDVLAAPRTIERRCAAESMSADEWIQRANAAAADADSSLTVLRGTVCTNGQDHFYIELPGAVVEAPPDGNVRVRCTTQNPAHVQRCVARVLGVPLHAVSVTVPRIGGGFGGKQERPSFLAAAATVASRKHGGRPVSLFLEREHDMSTMGKRHPFTSDYTCVLDAETGRVRALKVKMRANGGYTQDLSDNVVQVALAHLSSCYAALANDAAVHFEGVAIKTNRPSNTAYRGFGKPEATAVIESVVEHIASATGASTLEVRDTLMRRHESEASATAVTGGALRDLDSMHRCWAELRERADYDRRRAAASQFNAAHANVKRGIAMLPCRSNIGFEEHWMNQGGALVNVYADGSVSVSHGGVEMGQGLGVKIAQVCAAELSRCGIAVPLHLIAVRATCTDAVPNTHPTAATTGTEINARAVRNACEKLVERLSHFVVADNKTMTWPDLAQRAYRERVSLSAEGHSTLDFDTYDFATRKGDTTFYDIWSAACAEVEIDVLTGSFVVRRVDVVHDLGGRSSLNPAVDIGQIEGGLAQGIGLFTLEEPIWSSDDGHVRTRNVSTYKIPSHDDVPVQMHVHLLSPNADTRETRPLYSAKNAGESGLQLAFSVAAALRDAMNAAAKHRNVGNDRRHFDFPLTAQQILTELNPLHLPK
jgi:xanthine dehydrogenase/oxidase